MKNRGDSNSGLWWMGRVMWWVGVMEVAEVNEEISYVDDEENTSNDVGIPIDLELPVGIPYVADEENTIDLEPTVDKFRSKLTIRRQRNLESWRKNTRKDLRIVGKSYISARDKLVPTEEVETLEGCAVTCKFNCTDELSDERYSIYDRCYSQD